jgi:hypothetical protein
VDWSPQLDVALDTHRFWDWLCRRLSGKNIGYQRLKRLAKRVRLTSKLHCILEEAKSCCQQAWEDYKAVKSVADKLRDGWRHEQAKTREDAGLEPVGKGYQIGRQREQSRKNHRVIKRVLKDTSGKRLTRVSTTTTNSAGDPVVTTIERACLDETDARYRQANDRPLQHPIVLQALGIDGCSEVSTSILETGVIPEEIAQLDPYIAEYLAAHQVSPPAPPVDPVISTNAHKQGWLYAKERTSCSRTLPIDFE